MYIILNLISQLLLKPDCSEERQCANKENPLWCQVTEGGNSDYYEQNWLRISEK